MIVLCLVATNSFLLIGTCIVDIDDFLEVITSRSHTNQLSGLVPGHDWSVYWTCSIRTLSPFELCSY